MFAFNKSLFFDLIFPIVLVLGSRGSRVFRIYFRGIRRPEEHLLLVLLFLHPFREFYSRTSAMRSASVGGADPDLIYEQATIPSGSLVGINKSNLVFAVHIQ